MTSESDKLEIEMTEEDGVKTASVTINLDGRRILHARPIVVLNELASAYKCDVDFYNEKGDYTNVKSMNEMMLLAGRAKECIIMSVTGDRAEEAAKNYGRKTY